MTTNVRRGPRLTPLRAGRPVSHVKHRPTSSPGSPASPSHGHLRSRLRAHLDAFPVASDLALLTLALAATGAEHIVPTTVALVLLMAAADVYRKRISLSVLDYLPRMLAAAALSCVLVAAVFAPYDPHFGWAKLMAVTLAAVTFSRAAAYSIERYARRHTGHGQRTVIVGGGHLAALIAEELSDNRASGLELIAVLDDDPRPEVVAGLPVPTVPLRGNLRTYLSSQRIETAIIAYSCKRDEEMIAIVRECDRLECDILVVPRLWELTTVTRDMERLGTVPLSRVRRAAHRSTRWWIKLLIGRVLSGVLLLLLSPLLLVIATAVYLSDPSTPVLFRQVRIGLDGRTFELLKFRTMKPTDEHESATNWCVAGDSRLGRVGRFLRSTSLDELPQLWNVVRGDMTLVGPRPERPHFVEQFQGSIPNYCSRHRVPCGVTGLAAVNGLRGDTSIASRARYDNYYIDNWSLWLDFKILIRTVTAVFGMRGR